MIIGIDGNEANIEIRAGVNQYAFELLWAFRRTQKEWCEKHSLIVYLREKPRYDLPKETNCFSYKVIPGKGMWVITKLMPHLFFGSPKPNVFFAPNHYLPPLAPIPTVCSIMDLGYLESSEHFRRRDFWQLKLWSAWSMLVAKKVVAISSTTADDIVRHYRFTANKLAITLLGYDKSRYNTDINPNDVRRILKKYSIVNPYFLVLGTLKPNKNIERVIEAFSLINKNEKKDTHTTLVIAGKKGWLYKKIFEKVVEFGIEKDVIFTDYILEEDKPLLMAGAKALVSPSLWEGFGLHVLESIACGTPVIVSKSGSLPEVIAEAGIYVNPTNIDSIAKAMQMVLDSSEKEYNRWQSLGLERAKHFDWDNTGRETMKLLTSIK